MSGCTRHEHGKYGNLWYNLGRDGGDFVRYASERYGDGYYYTINQIKRGKER